MKRKTKIIATIGPASIKYSIFKKIIDEGADYIRINTAHSTEEQHQIIMDNLSKLLKLKSKKVGIIFDIRNNKILADLSKYHPSIIAISFTESVKQLRDVTNHFAGCKTIAKIESKKGVKNFKKILENSWGVMIARGDLGRAITLEKVPCFQKKFSELTVQKNKFLIVATEMLLSMTENPRPTRAEATDVANAVFNKASAVMLSEETAIGKYPVESVSYMRKIIEEAENCK